jgi:hypothetical protein
MLKRNNILDLYPTSRIKSNLKWIRNQNVSAKTIELLKENRVVCVGDFDYTIIS